MADVAAQVTLFEEPDDNVIDHNPEVTYIKVLDKFDFDRFQAEERFYYQALADFNRKLVKKLKQNRNQQHFHNQPATKADAYQELLFELLEQPPSPKNILFEIPSLDMDDIHHNPKGAGRKPKNFYGLVKAFLGVSYMGLKNSPDVVYSQLINNLSFAHKCVFNYIFF